MIPFEAAGLPELENGNVVDEENEEADGDKKIKSGSRQKVSLHWARNDVFVMLTWNPYFQILSH